MAQISRPFQIALVAVALLACVWFIALRGHSSSSSTSGSGSAPAESASTATHTSSGPTAPGVAGLTKDIAKAHGAAKISEQNNAQLAQKSAQASSVQSSTTPAATTSVPAKSVAPSVVETTPAPSKTVKATAKAPAPKISKTRGLTRQQQVEAQLAHGDIVLLLFWNNKGIDDKVVQREVVAAAHSPKVAMQQATASETAAFGTITRGVQVYSTPTVLVINGKGQAKVITGLTDAYVLRQAIAEQRHA